MPPKTILILGRPLVYDKTSYAGEEHSSSKRSTVLGDSCFELPESRSNVVGVFTRPSAIGIRIGLISSIRPAAA